MSTDQKKKLLWGNKKKTVPEEVNIYQTLIIMNFYFPHHTSF